MDQKPQNNKPVDKLINIKWLGYVRSQTPPGEDITMRELVLLAKFFLCQHSHRLWKDPIWDTYTDEEILVEYYSYLFAKDEKFRSEFEATINAGTEIYGEDIYEWLDRKVRENQEEMKKKLEEMPDKVSFSPDTLDVEK